MLISVVLLCLFSCIYGFPWFQTRIPNGDQVPNPCKEGSRVWAGVGHRSEPGAGSRNSFGNDFFQAGERWTVNFCQLDSDNDGKTNGAELGDPNCDWYVGQPSPGTPTGHPGICEPMHTPNCIAQNRGIYCNHGTGD